MRESNRSIVPKSGPGAKREKNNKSEFSIFLKNEDEMRGLIRDKYNMVVLLPTAQVWRSGLDSPWIE